MAAGPAVQATGSEISASILPQGKHSGKTFRQDGLLITSKEKETVIFQRPSPFKPAPIPGKLMTAGRLKKRSQRIFISSRMESSHLKNQPTQVPMRLTVTFLI